MRKEILFNGDFNNRNEVQTYIAEIISIEDIIVNELLVILNKSNDYWIKNEIALLLNRFHSDKILEALIKEISKPESYNRNGVLVDACSDYDCTKYFNLFIDLILKEPGESFLWAMDVLSAMEGPFNTTDVNLAIQAVDSVIKENSIPEKRIHLKKVLKYLKEILDRL